MTPKKYKPIACSVIFRFFKDIAIAVFSLRKRCWAFKLFFGFLFFSDLCGSSQSFLQNTLTLEAQTGVVCPNPGNVWIATGDVILKKGPLIIHADRIDLEFEQNTSEHAKSGKKSKKPFVDLTQPILSGPVSAVTAKGHVRIHHPSLYLEAESATYHFKTEHLCALGPGILLTNQSLPKETDKHPWILRCNKSLTYNQSSGIAHAIGTVRLSSQNKGLESDALFALFGPEKKALGSAFIQPADSKITHFKKDQTPPIWNSQTKKMQLYWARSNEKVRFWDGEKKIVAMAQYAMWDNIHQTTEMHGQVQIRHKEKYIRAGRAKIDFSSHILSITGLTKNTPCQASNTESASVYALIPTDSLSAKKG